MLRWALIFFVISLVAAVLGFSGISSTAAGMAELLFYVFLILFVGSLLLGLASRGDKAISKNL